LRRIFSLTRCAHELTVGSPGSSGTQLTLKPSAFQSLCFIRLTKSSYCSTTALNFKFHHNCLQINHFFRCFLIYRSYKSAFERGREPKRAIRLWHESLSRVSTKATASQALPCKQMSDNSATNERASQLRLTCALPVEVPSSSSWLPAVWIMPAQQLPRITDRSAMARMKMT
jgi:hypothetical protein